MNRRTLALMVSKRVGAALLILLFISFATFGLLYIAPGSPLQALLGNHRASPDVVANIEAKWHLDESFLAQYWNYLSGVLHLDFGTSLRSGQPVTEMVGQALPNSLYLGVYAFVLTIIGGVLGGIVAGLRSGTSIDRGVVGLSVAGISMPAFVTGFLLLYVFSVQLGWFPAIGAGSGLADRLSHLTLPAIALALSAGALLTKLTRGAMIGALEQDYVVFARARGLSRFRVVTNYALRNAMVPIVSGAGLVLAYVLTGAVLVETTFIIPGVGALLVEAVAQQDIPVVQAIALLFAALIVGINLMVDILYLAIDPRIRIGASDS